MNNHLVQKQALINQALHKYLPPAVAFPKIIHKAMRYSVLNGGKRLRAILALMVGELFGTPNNKIMPFACALEMVHAYSLIHDDLPAMDDDDFRRGKPTCHKAFGEAMAILAGDALLTHAFQIIADEIQNKKIIPDLISELAQAAGSIGMVGGQALDIQSTGRPVGRSAPKSSPTFVGAGGTEFIPAGSGGCDFASRQRQLKEIHLRKTAAMIAVSARGAGIISNATNKELSSVTSYARNLGLAFQIIDDILDVDGSKKQLGKTPGKDARHHKLTYPALKGLEASYKEANYLIKQAKNSLNIFPLRRDGKGRILIDPFGKRADKLKELADYLLKRKT